MMPWRAGLIGCGCIGAVYDESDGERSIYTHAGMYRSLPDFELVCAAETDQDRLTAFQRHWDVPGIYSDHSDLLTNEPLDILSIATPDDTHADLIREALKIRPPRLIFVEKPLAATPAIARELHRMAAEKNVTLCVDYVRRWDENHQHLRRLLHGGLLGRIESATGYYVRGLRHNGCQMINLMHYLLGAITTVQAVGKTKCGSYDDDPSLDLAIRFKNGARGHMIALDQTGYHFSIFELDLFGEKGRLRITKGGQSLQYWKTESDRKFTNFRQLAKSESPWQHATFGKAMVAAGKELSAFLADNSYPLQNRAPVAIDDLNVISAALESTRKGNSVVSVQPPPGQ